MAYGYLESGATSTPLPTYTAEELRFSLSFPCDVEPLPTDVLIAASLGVLQASDVGPADDPYVSYSEDGRPSVVVDGTPWVVDGKVVGDGYQPAVGVPRGGQPLSTAIALSRQWVSCANQGDLARYLTLLSRGELGELFNDESFHLIDLPDDEPGMRAALLATPSPLPVEEWRFANITLTSVKLTDGRFALLLEGFAPASIERDRDWSTWPSEPVIMIFRVEDSEMRIDEVVAGIDNFDDQKTPTHTPAS